MAGKQTKVFRKKKSHSGSRGDGKSSNKGSGTGHQRPLSVDEQLAALGPLIYNGGKAKNFQLYKKLKDLQLKERFGECGEFISTEMLYEPDAPKVPVRSKDIKPNKVEDDQDDDDDTEEEIDDSSKSKSNSAGLSKGTNAGQKKESSSKRSIVITSKGKAISSGSRDDEDDDDYDDYDNDRSKNEDECSDSDEENQGPRDGYYRGVKCYSRKEYTKQTAIYKERLKLYIKKVEEACGIHVKIISNLEQSISEASKEKIKEKGEYEKILRSKDPLAYW